jgi:uncharacterized iron-regulated membrane protein
MREYRRRAAYTRATVTRSGFLAACVGMFLILLSGSGLAQQPPTNLVQPPRISLQEAVSIATQSRPGRVVRAVTVDDGRTYEVRILLDEGGRVVTVRVDARTGQVD